MTSDVRYDRYGKVRLMAAADHYVMVRRPHPKPFVMHERDWMMLAPTADEAEGVELYYGTVRVVVPEPLHPTPGAEAGR